MRTHYTQVITLTRCAVAQAIAGARARRARKGQSLVELTLVLPIFMLLLMAAGEFGLALREQTALTQVLQQAAHYLADHPASSTSTACTQYGTLNNDNYGKCTADIIATYMNQHGFPAPSIDVKVSFGQNTFNQQQDTISVTYPYQIVLPIVDRINLCPATNSRGVAYPQGVLCVGATVSVVAATEAPTLTGVTAGSSGYQNPTIAWTPPYNPSGVTLTYNIYNCLAEESAPPLYLNGCKSDPASVIDVPGTSGGASCTGTAGTCSAQDIACTNGTDSGSQCSSSSFSYEVTAVQPDLAAGTDQSLGIESPRSPYAYGPPFKTGGP